MFYSQALVLFLIMAQNLANNFDNKKCHESTQINSKKFSQE